MKKYYRIKTFQEFGNKRPSLWNLNGEMDYLYGKFISDLECIPEVDDILDVDSWIIQGRDIIEVKSEFKVGDKVNLKGPVLSGVSHKGFTIVTMDADGAKMTIYSKEWDDNESGHNGEKRDLGTLNGRHKGHWNVDECEIKLAESPISKTYPDGEVKPVDPNHPFEDRPYHDEIIGTKYLVISNEKPYYQIGDIVEYESNDCSSSPLFYNPRRQDSVYIKWVHLQRINIETINLNLNTQDGSKISTTSSEFNTELFLCSVSATFSKGSSGIGNAVRYSGEEIILGS